MIAKCSSFETNIDGSLDFSLALHKQQFEVTCRYDPLNARHTSPDSVWAIKDQFQNFGVNMRGLKFRRGFFGQLWIGSVTLELRDESHFPKWQTKVGFLGAKRMEVLFAQFDKWLVGQYPPSLDLTATLEFA